ncbi:MAG: hypothetical protein HQL72_15590 [Magnetococcales bacterium]|nr:hypothetical protein [Magnetococcales bacterium]
MEDTTAQMWDCRWPDPVAITVATNRMLQARDPDDPALNRKLRVYVRPDPPGIPEDPISVLLVSPWGVERIYWSPPERDPPILHVAPLEVDSAGRIAAGQGVMLETSKRTVPVLIAWEPEPGHHFVETLLHSVRDYDSPEQAIAAIDGEEPPPSPKKSLSQHMEKKISRRGLFGFLDKPNKQV